MRAVITGITGFIGSHLAERLVARGDQVLGLGRTGRWRDDTPLSVREHSSIHAWDLVQHVDPGLQARLRDFAPDYVFHFAGMSIPSQCGQAVPTPQAIAVNVEGTRHFIEAIQTISPRPKLVFTSSCHVYARIDPDNPYVTEDSEVAPISAYGQTKLQCESVIQQQVQAGQLDACIARGFHHIGPRQPEGLMLTDWLGQLSKPDCAKIFVKSTNSYLDLIDVRDAVDAYLLLAEDARAQGIYNLGSGRISRSGAVLQAMLDLLGRPVEVVEESAAPRWNAIADIQKLQSLGWQPQRSYQDTIASMMVGIS